MEALEKKVSFMAMGDGGLYITGKCRNARFIMNMVKDNSDYLDLCKTVLSEVASVRLFDKPDYNKDGCTRKAQMRLETSVSPLFSEIHSRLYKEGHKGLDSKHVANIDWECLSYLYMSDGSAATYLRPEIGMISPSYKVTLNMKRLYPCEQEFLRDCISSNLGVDFSVHKQNNFTYLSLPVKHIEKFMENISPFMCESFKYKIINVERKHK